MITPASPWIGSTRKATVFGVIASSSALALPKGMILKPGANGPKCGRSVLEVGGFTPSASARPRFHLLHDMAAMHCDRDFAELPKIKCTRINGKNDAGPAIRAKRRLAPYLLSRKSKGVSPGDTEAGSNRTPVKDARRTSRTRSLVVTGVL